MKKIIPQLYNPNTPSKSRPGINVSEEVLYIPQAIIIGASYPDSFVSYSEI